MSLQPGRSPKDTLQNSEQELLTLFSRYSTVAIIANSEALDLDAVKRRLPADTLFVFFTHCNKVLSKPFDRDAVLCHRMRDRIVAMATPDQMQRARNLIEKPCLRSEMGLHVSLGTAEPPVENVSVETAPLPVIDLDPLFEDFYTAGQRPSSGFALAIWLSERLPGRDVVLCGFTGVRGEEFKTSPIHDWTLEQTVLRILYRDGRLTRFEGLESLSGSLAKISRSFPEFGDAEVALVAAQVLNDRVTAMDALVATLWSVTNLPRRIGDSLKRLRIG